MSLKKYFAESFQELRSVTWPTRRQAVRITFIVFLFMALSAVILGVVDELLAVGYRGLFNF